MTQIHHPHDMISKRFLTNIEVAVDFLKTYLPAKLVARCDFTTLAVEKSSYVEEHLREHLADILYSLNIDGKMGFIYILLEVQTTPLRKMPLRVLRYLTSIWKDHAESHPDTEPLPVILPLVFYTGEKPYHYSLDFLDCFADPDFARSIFYAPIRLIDLSGVSDTDIKSHGRVAPLELVAKHIWQRDILNFVHQLAALLNAPASKMSRDLFEDLLKYIISEGDSQNFKAFLEILITEAPAHKETVVNIAQRLRNEGFHQGVLEGKLEGEHEKAIAIAKNLLARHIDFDVIKGATGLSDEDLSKLLTMH